MQDLAGDVRPVTPGQDGIYDATDLAHAAKREKLATQVPRSWSVPRYRAQIISFGILLGGNASMTHSVQNGDSRASRSS
jgi:hypothetical protein